MSPALALLVAAGLFVLAASLERVPALQFRRAPFLRRYLGTDLAWYAVATTANVLAAFVVLPLLSGLAIPGVADTIRGLPWAARLAIALAVFDVCTFAVHAWMHRSTVLWSIHKVHHSSLHLDWLATTRAHMGENAVRQVLAQIPLFMLGMPASVVAVTLVIYAAFAIFGHSNLRIGGRVLEWAFVTPRLHRRHHVPATSLQNLGTIFTLWDRLTGFFVSADTAASERFGVPDEIDSYPQRFAPALRRPFEEARARREVRTRPASVSPLLGSARHP
jgi:sterol desaturase/sphingolipid hydroxylase (fatty acid hydroxylase superfamily)